MTSTGQGAMWISRVETDPSSGHHLRWRAAVEADK
jgi:hypothetical protein